MISHPPQTISRAPRMGLVLGVLLALSAGGCTPPPREADPYRHAVTSLGALPVLTGWRYRQVASTDRGPASSKLPQASGNKDFNNFVAICGPVGPVTLAVSDRRPCERGVEGHVLAALDDGPGFVSRIWLAAAPILKGPTYEPGEVIRIYTDDLTRPALTVPFSRWKAGDLGDTFRRPLAGLSSGALLSYAPLAYRRSLRVVLGGLRPNKLYYYQVGVQGLAGASPPVPPRTGRRARIELSRAILGEARRAPGARVLARRRLRLAPGGLALLLDQRGPGTITFIEIQVEKASAAALREARLLARWDDRRPDAVDAPLGAFFGQYWGIGAFKTLPMEVTGRAGGTVTLRSYLPAPFRRRARVWLESRGRLGLTGWVRVDGVDRAPAGTWGHLHAYFGSRRAPAVRDERYVVADLRGAGRYVGTVMFMSGQDEPDSVLKNPWAFLEGDEEGEIDGERTLLGTGTEDYFNGGFYFADGPFSSPFASVTHQRTVAGGTRGEVAAMRWHVLGDVVEMRRSFKLTFEYGANQAKTLHHYASVAFFYLVP